MSIIYCMHVLLPTHNEILKRHHYFWKSEQQTRNVRHFQLNQEYLTDVRSPIYTKALASNTSINLSSSQECIVDAGQLQPLNVFLLDISYPHSDQVFKKVCFYSTGYFPLLKTKQTDTTLRLNCAPVADSVNPKTMWKLPTGGGRGMLESDTSDSTTAAPSPCSISSILHSAGAALMMDQEAGATVCDII